MGILKDLGKVGLGGVAGIVANKGMLPKLSGIGMLQRELGMGKKRRAAEAAAMEIQKKGAGMRGRPMVEDIMMAEEAPAGAPMMKKGGKVSAAQAVHKHERAKHKGQPLTKMAKGGSTASKRADGCATKGKTKGKFV